MHACGTSVAHNVRDWVRAVNGRSVPGHQDRAWDLAGGQRHEANNIRAIGGMVVGVHHDRSFRSHRTTSRQMVAGQWAQMSLLPVAALRTRPLISEGDGPFFPAVCFPGFLALGCLVDGLVLTVRDLAKETTTLNGMGAHSEHVRAHLSHPLGGPDVSTEAADPGFFGTLGGQVCSLFWTPYG